MQSRVGQGTSFAFDLPCVAAAEERADPRPVAPSAHIDPLAILVVEDDTAVRESFVLLLQICGHIVHGVSTGAEALELVAGGHPFDVMMTDYRLPDADGTDVIREGRTLRGIDFPAVLLTGETKLDEIRARAIAKCRIMSKTVKIPLLIEALAQFTSHSE